MRGQRAFCDVRVFNPLAKRHASQDLKKCFEINEREKKRAYNERILEVEHGSFTLLVFSATGGVGEKAINLKRLVEMISFKENKTLV